MLIEGSPVRLGPWKAIASSVASRATFIVIPALDLILDAGWAVEAMRPRGRLLLSHTHLDHVQGLPMWVSWRQRSQPPTIWLHRAQVDVVDALLRSAAAANGQTWRYTLIGLAEGDTVALDGRHTLSVFETTHHVPTLGALVTRRRRRLRDAHRGVPPDQVTPQMLEEIEVPELCYTSDTTPGLFDRRPDLLASQTLITECTHIDGVLAYVPGDDSTLGERPDSHHTHVRALARRLTGFTGRHLVLGHFPAKMIGCDLRALLLTRLPPAAAERLSVLPTVPIPGIGAQPPPRPASLPPLDPAELPPHAWEIRERPGHFGWRRAARLAELSTRYPDHQIVHTWRGRLLGWGAALALYEEAYVRHLEAHPALLQWLVQAAADVYDTSPANTSSGLDYDAQHPDEPHHLQDVAVRRALWRLGRWFEGDQLLEIRSTRSRGYALNPGIVPFHEPDAIAPRELPSWVLPGSIEAFWQSNRVVVTPRG